MMNRLKLVVILLVYITSCGSFIPAPPRKTPVKASTYTITIKITDIRNKSGHIVVQLYKDQESFTKEIPWKSTRISKENLNGRTIIHKISGFKPGVYGLALHDDENRNNKMDYGWVLPKEGFGFSDYFHTAFSKPKFDNFKFNLRSDKTVTIRVRYM